jgi:hypothetical protein
MEDFWMFWERHHSGNDDHDDHDDYNDYMDCDWVESRMRCSDFEMGRQDYIDYGNDCDIYLSYSPCVTDFFVCESTAPDSYGNMRTDDCTGEFEDPEFWEMLRDDEWWMQVEN